jgi:DNA-binding protein HU-beta
LTSFGKKQNRNINYVNGGEVKKMTKSELISTVAAKAGLKKKEAEATVNAVFDEISNALIEGNKVQIIGFGTFDVRERKARQGKNPQTKETIEIPASKSAAFRPGKALKDAVNK